MSFAAIMVHLASCMTANNVLDLGRNLQQKAQRQC